MQKVWAAKLAARHPNLAVLDLSSFKCGHDAPTYGLIDRIIAAGGTPYSALHDIDANKPDGSIKIRIKTYAHTCSCTKSARGRRCEEALAAVDRRAGAARAAAQLEAASAIGRLRAIDAPPAGRASAASPAAARPRPRP